jgi:5-methylthioadenosine/S-adenosylhomocysteine deaminase
MTRRDYLKSSAAGVLGGAIAAGCTPQSAGLSETLSQVPNGDRILLRGGCVLTLDPELGDFETADVLIEGSRIVAVEPNLEATAQVVDASQMIVMPGFVDTHRHIWEGMLRNILPNGLLSDYTRDITGAARAVFRPEDAYIGDLLSALGAMNAGVTTLLDWSHVGNSPDHTDDIRRLRSTHFSSEDQLLTLSMATGLAPDTWAIAREVGAPITVHVNGREQTLGLGDRMGPDVTFIHCPNLTETEWQMVADTGVGVSIACPIEMQMGHGIPPIQQALDHGIRPSLSADVETEIPSDFFTQMRTVFGLQRMMLLARQATGEAAESRLLTVREVIEFATIEGARVNGLDARIGTLTPGKEADIILLRMDRINVLAVVIRGEFRKWRGELVDVDLERVSRLAHASRDYVISEAGWPQTLLGGYLPGH